MKDKELSEYIEKEIDDDNFKELKKHYKTKRKFVFIYIPIFVAILLGVLMAVGIAYDISIGISTIKEGIIDGTKLWGLSILAYYASILIILFFNTFIKGWLGLILSAIPIINFIYFAFLLVYYIVGAGVFGGVWVILLNLYYHVPGFIVFIGWGIGFVLFFSFESYVATAFDDYLTDSN